MGRPKGIPIIRTADSCSILECDSYLFLIDKEDVPLVSKYNWHVKISNNSPYAYAHLVNNTKVILHRLVMGLSYKDGKICDHKNRNTLDNRKCNLRVCSRKENNRNSKKNKRGTSSIYKGVTKRPSGRFGVYINDNGRSICLGTYDTQEEAALVYNKKALELFGEYANINIIGDQYE